MASAKGMMMISQNVNSRAPQTHNATKEKKKKRQRESVSGQQDQKNQPNVSQEDDGEMQNTDKIHSDDKHEKKNNKVLGKGARKTKKKQSRAGKMEMEKDKVEQKRLERLLFGTIHDQQLFTELGNEFEQLQAENTQEKDTAAWFTDKTAGSQIYAYEEEHLKLQREEGFDKKPVWIDDEEAETKVDITKANRLRKLRTKESEDLISGTDYINRLRLQHAKLNPGTEWANLDRKKKDVGFDSDSDSELENGFRVSKGFDGPEYDILRSNDDLVVRSKQLLLPGQIEYSMLTDANAEDPSNAAIQSVGFHRNGQLLLTAGLDKRLKFFQIDGKRNPKIQSVFIGDLPLHKASFLPDGSKVIAAGRRKFFYSFDVVKGVLDRINCLIGREERSLESFEVSTDSSMIAFLGNEGYILLVSTKTKQLIGTLKMNGTARALSFADDGRQLLSSGGDGQVYHWDLRTRKCIHRETDEGCVNSSALSVSPNSNIFATGSDSGIVNIYNRNEFLGGMRKPLKVLTNLVTVVDNLKFNCDSQILAICSRMKKNSVRLVHLPSCTVFTNWPSNITRLQYVHSLDFSPAGGFLAVGNAAGKVLLFKLHHYQHA